MNCVMVWICILLYVWLRYLLVARSFFFVCRFSLSGRLVYNIFNKIENIKSSGLDIGDTFTARGCTWTVISDGLALCDRCISDHCFRRECRADNANVYQFSDVKKFIEGWWGNAA